MDTQTTVFILVYLAIIAFFIYCGWKMFEKAGRPGWEVLVPFYNLYIMTTKIALLPAWYIILFFIPIANIYALFKIYISIAHNFGKSTGFGIGLIFLGFIFLPILALGDAEFKKGETNLEDNLVG